MTQTPLVLVVDDYADARELYVELLLLSGYRVEEAADGQEALDKAFALQPDVILLDLTLPVVDGWEASRRLREDPRTATIPVVALTGHSPERAQAAQGAPACDALLTKPCSPDTMLQTLERVLRR